MTHLTEPIATHRHALWLGAGISVGSGVPTVVPLVKRLLQGLGISDVDRSRIEDARMPFESLFEVLMSVADCGRLFDVFRGDMPSLTHRAVAILVRRGVLHTILTTNFDTLIEQALNDEGIAFDLFTTDESFSSIDWSSGKIRVIKLHGSVSDTAHLAITVRRVASHQGVDIRGQVVQRLIASEERGGLVVAGYSCSDHFDVSPAVRAAARPDRRILYVAHSEMCSHPSIARLSDVKPRNPFADFDAACLTCDTDDFFRAIWQIVAPSDAEPSRPISREWERAVDEWLAQTAQEAGMHQYVSGLIFKGANLWLTSSNCLLNSIRLDLPKERRARAFLAVGNNYRDLGSWDVAQSYLHRAVELARDGSDTVTEARVLNSLGILSEDRSDHEAAIGLYLDALELAEQTADRELVGKCHGNLGIAYKNRAGDGDFDRALKHHSEELEVAVDIGDKRSEGRTLGNIGLVHRSLQDSTTACRYYAEAASVAETLGDLLHVGIWLHNTGEDIASKQPDAARQYLIRARDVFSSLGQEDLARQSREALVAITT